ncbi:MAG TPA: anthranilate synthase component I [Rhodospirillaceae bacterium]|jgi:anthranilate synthase component 1|nr:chorismate-binding protein [Alphaproteobacteria bacterium]HBH26712.1 anthranilate synthase component I [Rhodospirillaceae bacterium]
MSLPEPDFDAFARAYDAGAGALAWRWAPADLVTPVAAYLKLCSGAERPNSFLFESVEGGAHLGRYCLIGLEPDLVWEAPAQGAAEGLRALIAASRIGGLPPGLPPAAAGGLFGMLGYGVARWAEPRVKETNPDPLALPTARLIRPGLLAVFDTVMQRICLSAPAYPAPGMAARAAWDAAHGRLTDAAARLAGAIPPMNHASALTAPLPVACAFGQSEYEAAVCTAKAHIFAGDIFQVVPSRRFSVPFDLPPFALYRALRALNPSPFLFHMAMDGWALVGSSPEVLVRLQDGVVTIRPLAGTRPRGADAPADAVLEADLLADAKERAEHLMLLDLGRNDVGRVAKVGSVEVPARFVVERYSHVMHISSTVTGRLRTGCDAVDALLAGFPAGTVSGAPKVRAMEIIDDLEPVARSFYGGAVGYFGANGGMDTCIALRTGLVKDGALYIQAGAGIVAASDPATEYAETEHKARALVAAAEAAVSRP